MGATIASPPMPRKRTKPLPSRPVLQAEFRAWMLDERGWLPSTRRTRAGTANEAEAWMLEHHHRRLARATREQILEFISRARSPRTRNRKLADLKGYGRFLRDRVYRRSDPASTIERVREPRTLPRPLSKKQASRLVRAACELSLRAWVIVVVLLHTGIRREEAAALAWADVNLEDRELRVLGKGAKERVIPLHRQAADALAAWRMHRNGTGYVFPPGWTAHQHISPTTLWRDVRDAARHGRVRAVSPHVLRHTFATHLLEGGTDIRHVQELLGHASLSSTQIYTKVVTMKLRPEVDRLDFGG